jgi:sec-independent protein translocase protein TatB
MFDIGFTEMVIIAVVALVVLGPERLPKVAKQAGEWLGKLQRYVNDVKSDISRQVELEELRKMQAEVKDAAKSVEQGFNTTVNEAQAQLDSISGSFDPLGTSASESEAPTDWDTIYANRRTRERLKDRRRERDRDLGLKRPKRSFVK